MENEFQYSAPARLEPVEWAASITAADAMANARANILASVQARDSNFDSRTSNFETWGISDANIPGAEPGESPLMTVFRLARTEIGGWGTQGYRAEMDASRNANVGARHASPAAEGNDVAAQMFNNHPLLAGARGGATIEPEYDAESAAIMETGEPGISPRPGGGAIRPGDDRETEPPVPSPTPTPTPIPGPRPVPRPIECTCTLHCFDLHSGRESPDQCNLDLWCEAIGPGNTEYKFTPLRGLLELGGPDEDVSWEIKTSGQFPDRYIQLSAVDPGQISKLKVDPKIRLTGTDPCKGTRYVFAITPTSKAIQKLIDGDMAPASEDVIALLNGEECARFTVTIQPKPCDEKTLKARATAFNERAPNFTCFTFQKSAEPVSKASALSSNPDAVLAITVDIQMAINASVLFECPDCCCEFYSHGFLWVTVTAQWVQGTKGAEEFAAAKQAELAELFMSDAILDGMTAIVKQRYPRCSRSKNCPTPLPEIFEHTLGPDLYTAQDINLKLDELKKSQDKLEEDCLVEAAQAASSFQQGRWPSPADTAGGGARWISFGGWKPYFSSTESIIDELKSIGGAKVELNDSKGLVGYIKLIIDIHPSFELRRHDSSQTSCWCVVGTGFLVKLAGELVLRNDLPDLDSWVNYGRQHWEGLTSNLMNNLEYQRAFLSRYTLKVPRCFADRSEAEKYMSELTRGGDPHGNGWRFREESVLPLQCAKSGAAEVPVEVNARGMLGYELNFHAVHGKDGQLIMTHHYTVAPRSFEVTKLNPGELASDGVSPCCILIWVHGYNTNLANAQGNLREIQDLYARQNGCCRLIGFYWNGDPPERRFFGAAIGAANVSAVGLARTVHDIHERYPMAAINIAGHSLGTRVILGAVHYLPPNTVKNLILFNAAVDNECLEPGQEFADVPAKVDYVYVVHNRNDDVLTNLALGIGAYEAFAWDHALGETGPEHPFNTPNNVIAFDVTGTFAFVPDEQKGETHHSALYLPRVSKTWFANEFPRMISNDPQFCSRTR